MCWNCKSLNSKIQRFWFWNGTLRWVHIGWCKFLWKSLWQAKLLVPFLLGNELGDSRAIARAWVWGSNISSDDLDKFESVEGTYSKSENCGKDVQFMVLPAWRLLREAVLPKGISQGGADRQQEGSDLLWHPHFLEPPVQLLEDWPPEWRHGRLFEVRRSCPVSLGNEERLESRGSPSLRSMRGQRFLLCARATHWPGWKGGASQGISECFQLDYFATCQMVLSLDHQMEYLENLCQERDYSQHCFITQLLFSRFCSPPWATKRD